MPLTSKEAGLLHCTKLFSQTMISLPASSNYNPHIQEIEVHCTDIDFGAMANSFWLDLSPLASLVDNI